MRLTVPLALAFGAVLSAVAGYALQRPSAGAPGAAPSGSGAAPAAPDSLLRRGRAFVGACAAQDVVESVVAFVAGVLVHAVSVVALERKLQARRPPQFKPTLELK